MGAIAQCMGAWLREMGYTHLMWEARGALQPAGGAPCVLQDAWQNPKPETETRNSKPQNRLLLNDAWQNLSMGDEYSSSSSLLLSRLGLSDTKVYEP